MHVCLELLWLWLDAAECLVGAKGEGAEGARDMGATGVEESLLACKLYWYVFKWGYLNTPYFLTPPSYVPPLFLIQQHLLGKIANFLLFSLTFLSDLMKQP